MKTWIYLALFLIGSQSIHGDEFPDIRKSFTNAKHISTTEIDPFNKIMSFGSDDSYEELKAQLLKTLGEGWIESPQKHQIQPKQKNDDLKVPGPPKLDLAGNTILINRKFPSIKVRLTVFKTTIFKTKHSILLAIERKKTQKKDK